MKRAWMLWSVAVIAVITAAGCETNGVGSWSSRWPRPKQDVTSEPIKEKPITGDAGESPIAQLDTSKEPPPGGVDQLATKVQTFVSQFPADDRDRAAGVTAAAPTSAPAVAQKVETPVTAPIPIARVPEAATPTAVMANVPAVSANTQSPKPVAKEAAASPKPVQIVPEGSTVLPRIEITEVRAAAIPAAASQPSAAAANQPVQPIAPAPATDGIGSRIAELEQAVAMHPQQMEDQFKLRMLYVVTGQDDKAIGPMNGMDPIQTELISGIFRLMVGARDMLRSPASAGPAALVAAQEVQRLLGQQASVIIPKIALVTRVNSFGDYDAVNPPKFTAGQPVHVFLYAEVGNFRSESTSDGRLRTWLAEKVEIFNQAGKVIWERSEPSIEDRVYSARRDFFMTMEIQLPAETPAGEYVLKATVEDKLGATTDQQRMSFTIQ